MKLKVKDLKGRGILVVFGPASNPERFKIDLLEEARQRLSFGTIDLNELELEIGDRLGEKPYPITDRTTMPPTYLCEGSVWVNFYTPDGKYANISLVPHMDKTETPPHHNFWLYLTDFDGRKGSDKRISGHRIPIDEPIIISISCGEETRKGTITLKR